MKIGIDLDGVISDFVREFNKIVRIRYDYDLKESEIYVHDIYLVLGIPFTESKEIIEDTLSRNLKLVDNAKKSIDELKEKHKILILTARDEKFRKKTQDWLNEHSIHYDNIFFLKDICPFSNKGSSTYLIFINLFILVKILSE